MNFLKNLFEKKDVQIKSYSDFWNWFQRNEKDFFKVIKQQSNIEKGFFNKLSSKLDEFMDGFFYVTGMYDENTVELILTPDGHVKNIVFVEELVKAAPEINGWKFTALKPSLNIEDVTIKMDGVIFDSSNLFFYSNNDKNYPDEIDITIVHNDFTEEKKQVVINGTLIFLDNYLGELNFVTTVDNFIVTGRDSSQPELVPIKKLRDFLDWRQKEFIEKYEGVRRNTENDTHSVFEAEHESGSKLFAAINTELLMWESKASHPWVAIAELQYDGSNNNGMPDNETYGALNEIENEIVAELKDFDGYLNIGRQTAKGVREIYFACSDFRKPSKVFYNAKQKYSNKFGFDYSIYKDKYWRTFDRFIPNT